MEIKKSKKNVKFTTIAWIMAVILLVIIIPINILVSVFNVQLDLTQSHMFSLTDTTKDYLSNLDEKVDFYFLIDMDEVRADDEFMSLTSMIDEYKEFECINFVDVDPDTNPEIKAELNPEGFFNFSKGDIVIRCGENVKTIKGTSLYTVNYDADGNQISESFNGENYITGAIKTVVEGKLPSVYFLTGHGEKSLANDYTQFDKNLRSANYIAKQLNLVTAEAVPDDAAIIVIASPKSDISDAEREKIEKFMDGGGNLSLLMSPNDEDFAYTNIEIIMAQYGIGMDYNLVSETDSSKHISGDKNKIIVNLVDTSTLDDENITDLTSTLITETQSIIPYMPASRSFYEIQSSNRTNLTICPLIETYDSAIAKPYGGVEVDPDEFAGIAYLSAYSEDKTRNNSKLIVMGNAEFIDDENVSEEYVMVPVMLYLSSISWMYNSDINIGIPPKINSSDYMTLKSKEDTTFMLVILNAAPVIVACAGILIWLKRRNA